MRENRRAKIKKTIKGTADKPRLVVFRSSKYFYGQIIDDVKGHTLASIDKIKSIEEGVKTLLEKSKKAKVEKVVFDRAGYRYHGKIKKFAEGLREGGVKF